MRDYNSHAGGGYNPTTENNNFVDYNTAPTRSSNNNGGSYTSTTENSNFSGGYSNLPTGNNDKNGGYKPTTENNNGGGYTSTDNNNGGQKPTNENNNGDYKPTNENNGGGYSPPTDNNDDHKTINEHNSGVGDNNPHTENNNGGGYNSPSENNNGGYNPTTEYNNGGGYTSTDSNNVGYNPTTEYNNGGGYTPTDSNNGGHKPTTENNNGGGYNPPTENNNGANTTGCKCVAFYLCADDSIAEDGVGMLDIRIPGECGTYDQKCCDAVNIRPPDKPVIDTKPPPAAPNKRCGIRNSDGIKVRIIGAQDQEAQYAEFPWMVAVVQTDAILTQDGEPIKVYQCGGSLIHPRVVLTGAHCVRGKKNLVIRAGEWDTQTKNELYPTQDHSVQEVIVHEMFNNKSLANDPALLILDSPVDMTYENVGLICLPEEGENMDGRDCVASGWGKDQFGREGKYQVILKRVDLPVVPRGPCVEALRKTRLGTHFKLHDSFICAGGIPGEDTCKGDGGSPLACPSKDNPDVYVQAGIVAWGIDCGTENPAVYVNVPHFITWIRNKLQGHGISLG